MIIHGNVDNHVILAIARYINNFNFAMIFNWSVDLQLLRVMELDY